MTFLITAPGVAWFGISGVFWGLLAGATVAYSITGITSLAASGRTVAIAVADIAAGLPVLKYGQIIGGGDVKHLGS